MGQQEGKFPHDVVARPLGAEFAFEQQELGSHPGGSGDRRTAQGVQERHGTILPRPHPAEGEVGGKGPGLPGQTCRFGGGFHQVHHAAQSFEFALDPQPERAGIPQMGKGSGVSEHEFRRLRADPGAFRLEMAGELCHRHKRNFSQKFQRHVELVAGHPLDPGGNATELLDPGRHPQGQMVLQGKADEASQGFAHGASPPFSSARASRRRARAKRTL